jgi:2-dehydro-3-deoxyphosphogluconate aldolase / (4S)-4-hydroxy-2-oxoglutarate aldolase
MTREEVRERIASIGIIPSIRSSSREDALFAAEAVASGGIPIVEVTMTVEGALEVIGELARAHPEIVVGAGTVLDVETARKCLDAGACFVTSPGFDPEIVEFALKQRTVVFPGALTPSEVMLAWKAGSDFVKVFPCAPFGGPEYIKTLKAPFPQIPLIATGGVNQQTVAPSIHAGAVAVGIGANLIQPRAIAKRERDWIVELAHRYCNLVRTARAELPEPGK